MASSATTSTPNNFSVKAIPGAFALALVPHSYYLIRLMSATRGQLSFAMPRTNLETWKTKLPADLWNHLARARGAHINSLEVFPLFAAAVLAGNAAKLPAKDMDDMALSFLAARTLYLGLYLGIKSNTLAYARTGVYAWSIGIPLMTLWRAGNAGGGDV